MKISTSARIFGVVFFLAILSTGTSLNEPHTKFSDAITNIKTSFDNYYNGKRLHEELKICKDQPTFKSGAAVEEQMQKCGNILLNGTLCRTEISSNTGHAMDNLGKILTDLFKDVKMNKKIGSYVNNHESFHFGETSSASEDKTVKESETTEWGKNFEVQMKRIESHFKDVQGGKNLSNAIQFCKDAFKDLYENKQKNDEKWKECSRNVTNLKTTANVSLSGEAADIMKEAASLALTISNHEMAYNEMMRTCHMTVDNLLHSTVTGKKMVECANKTQIKDSGTGLSGAIKDLAKAVEHLSDGNEFDKALTSCATAVTNRSEDTLKTLAHCSRTFIRLTGGEKFAEAIINIVGVCRTEINYGDVATGLIDIGSNIKSVAETKPQNNLIDKETSDALRNIPNYLKTLSENAGGGIPTSVGVIMIILGIVAVLASAGHGFLIYKKN